MVSIAFFGGILALTQRVMLPPAVLVYLAYTRLFAVGPLVGYFLKVTGESLLQVGNLHVLHVWIPYMALRLGKSLPDGRTSSASVCMLAARGRA